MTERSCLKRESFKGKEKKGKKERKSEKKPEPSDYPACPQRGCARDAIARAAPLRWRDGIPRYPPALAIKPAHVHCLPEAPVSFFLPRIREFTQRRASSASFLAALRLRARRARTIIHSGEPRVQRYTHTHTHTHTREYPSTWLRCHLSHFFKQSFIAPSYSPPAIVALTVHYSARVSVLDLSTLRTFDRRTRRA